MNRQTREYDLAELIENPGLGLAMRHEGVERRTMMLLLGNSGQRKRPEPQPLPDPTPDRMKQSTAG